LQWRTTSNAFTYLRLGKRVMEGSINHARAYSINPDTGTQFFCQSARKGHDSTLGCCVGKRTWTTTITTRLGGEIDDCTAITHMWCRSFGQQKERRQIDIHNLRPKSMVHL